MEPDDDKVKDVYAHFGLAAYCGQCFEANLSNVLILGARVRGEALTLADVDRMELTNQKKTMGALIRDLRDKTKLPAAADDLIGRALDRRNFLNHHFFRERAEDFMSVAGCNRMIAELKQIQEVLEMASQAQCQLAMTLSAFLGITPEMLSVKFDHMVAKARDA